jgi:hypothetical protein
MNSISGEKLHNQTREPVWQVKSIDFNPHKVVIHPNSADDIEPEKVLGSWARFTPSATKEKSVIAEG